MEQTDKEIRQILREAVNAKNPRQSLQAALKKIELPTGTINTLTAVIHGQICSLEDKVEGMWTIISNHRKSKL